MCIEMEVAILDQSLRYRNHYVRYDVPNSTDQGPSVTILVPLPDKGTVAILFIPYDRSIQIPPNFVRDTVKQHWQILGSHITGFIFYSFDPRTEDPRKDNENVIPAARPGSTRARLSSAVGYLSMVYDNSRVFHLETRGTTSDVAEEAREMGCEECDGFELLRGLDGTARALWISRLKLTENADVDCSWLRMRAIFGTTLTEALGFLPYTIVPDGAVSIKEFCLDTEQRDWRHVRRVLLRSVHERLPGKFLRMYCPINDVELLNFLLHFGYENLGSSVWIGEYS